MWGNKHHEHQNEKIAYIQSTLADLKKAFKADRERHKYSALVLKLSIAVLSALAMVFLGWQSSSESTAFQNAALVMNALITIIATYEAFYKPKKLWARETKVFSELKDLERDFNFEILKGTLDDDALSKYKDRITIILNNSLKEWVAEKSRDA